MATPLISTEEWLQSPSGTPLETRLRYIAKLGKTKDSLGLRIKRKLELYQELSEFERAYVERPPPRPHKDYILSKTNHGHFTSNQTAELDSMSSFQYSISAFLTFVRFQPEVSVHDDESLHSDWHKTYKWLHDFEFVYSKGLFHEKSDTDFHDRHSAAEIKTYAWYPLALAR
jgi:hypothetical protein